MTASPLVPDAQRPEALLAAALAVDGARPLVTFYDDATGERVELSVATMDNWVAKTANLIVDGLAAPPGGRVTVGLPVHWQSAVWLLAAWSAGTVVAPGGDPDGAAVAVTEPAEASAAVAAGASEVVVASLRPLGAPVAGSLPAGALDYAVEIPAYGDRFRPVRAPEAASPALQVGGSVLTGREVARAALGWALPPGSRVLSTLPYTASLEAIMAGLLAPLAAGGSVVLCRNADPDALGRRSAVERVTATAGTDLQGLPRLC